MTTEESEVITLKQLNGLRTAPILNKKQTKILLEEVEHIICEADWVTIGIMAPSIKEGIQSIREIEEKFKFKKMKCITIPSSDGPIFLKANQKTCQIHTRVEYGLGEGILISCHNDDNSKTSKTIGPFPLDFFN